MADQVEPKEAAAPAAAAAPAQAPAASGAKPAKKSNTCMIIVVIVLVLLVLAGAIGFFAYRYVKNKVKNVVDTATDSTTSTSTTATTDATSSDQEVKNNYNNTSAVSPTSDMGKTYSAEIEAILKPIFGGAKLTEWMDLNDGNTMGFLVPRKVTSTDFSAIETAFINKGYSKDANYTTSDEMSIYLSNTKVQILLGCVSGEAVVRATVSNISE